MTDGKVEKLTSCLVVMVKGQGTNLIVDLLSEMNTQAIKTSTSVLYYQKNST
jgi:hypothetical protein